MQMQTKRATDLSTAAVLMISMGLTIVGFAAYVSFFGISIQ
jgi:diacylglycerol kinase